MILIEIQKVAHYLNKKNQTSQEMYTDPIHMAFELLVERDISRYVFMYICTS